MRRMLFNLLAGRVEKLLAPYRDGIAAAAIPGSGGVAFLGDSITHMGRWDLLFPDAHTKNFGVSGETSAHVLGRLAPVIAVRPRLILILIGTNDLFWDVPADDIVRNVEAVVTELKTALPRSRIVLQGVMPRAQKYAARIRALNSRYARIADRCGVGYLDLFALFDDGAGGLRSELTHDHLHLLGKGYAVWRDAIAPLVAADNGS